MFEPLYLCASTIDGADLRTRIDAATYAGYQGIGLRPGHLARELERGTTTADVRSELADAGLELVEIGFLSGWWEEGDKSRRHEDSLYRLKDELGGRHMMLIGGPLDRPRDEIAERLGAVAERAARHELTVALEFLPWTDTGDIATAWDLVARSGAQNAGVVLDTWHHARGDGTDDDLDLVPADRIVTIQISDGPLRPVGTELEDTFQRRRLPGTGEFDLARTLGRAANLGVRAPLGVEVLSDELRALEARDATSRAASATRSVISQVTPL